MKQSLLSVHLFLTLSILTGCASSIYGWQVRTASTPLPSSFEPTFFQQEPVALFPAVAVPGRGRSRLARE
jgi:hypothetical protein